MATLAAPIDPEWFKSQMLIRKLSGQSLIERRIVTSKTLAKLTHGRPVDLSTWERINAVFQSTPVELTLVAQGLK